MKKWKIRGSEKFKLLLNKLISDNKISTILSGDVSSLFYGVVDGYLCAWELDESGHFSYEEITVEKLEQLYYLNNINIVNADYVKYVGVQQDCYRIPNTIYKVYERIEGFIDTVVCNVRVDYLSPGDRMFISNENNWVAATEAEYLAQVTPTTKTNLEEFKIGDWVYAEKSDEDYRDSKYIPVFQVKDFNEVGGDYLRPVADETTGVHKRHCRKALSHEIPTIPVDEPLKSQYLIAAEKALKHFKDAGFYVKCEYENTSGKICKSKCELTIVSENCKDCYIECGEGFLWEYERNGQIDVYGKLILNNKPQSMEREFQIGDSVECVDEYDNISVGMQGVIVEIGQSWIGVSWYNFTSGHNCDSNCSYGTGYYINKNKIKLINTLSSNIPTSQEFETYGLQVGDRLDVNVLNAWTVIEGNRSADNKTEWHQGEPKFLGNRVIKSFHLIHGHVGLKVSGTNTVYLKAKGFKEFADNYHKKLVNHAQLQHPLDTYDILTPQGEQLTQKEINQTQELLTLPTNKIYVRKSKSIK